MIATPASVLILVGFCASGAPPGILGDIDNGRVLDRGVAIRGPDMDADARTKAAIAAFESYRSKRELFQIVFSESERGGTLAVSNDDSRPSTWEQSFAEMTHGTVPNETLVRVLGIRGQGTLFKRTGGNLVKQSLTGGSDASFVSFSGTQMEVAQLRLERSAAPFGEPDYTLHVYLVARSRVSVSGAREAARTFANWSGTSNVFVTVRNDPWFLPDLTFPAVLPWFQVPVPSSVEEYKRAPEARCMWFRGKVNCSSKGI